MAGLRQTTGDWTDVFVKGVWAHNIIEEYYKDTYGIGKTVFLEYSIPESSSKKTNEQGYADIVNESTGEIFEIKSALGKGPDQGLEEVEIYVAKANVFCSQIAPRAWHKGIEFATAEFIWPLDITQKLVAELNQVGVITYRVIPNKNPQLVPNPVVLPVPDQVLEAFKKIIREVSVSPSKELAENVMRTVYKELSSPEVQKAFVVALGSAAIVGGLYYIGSSVASGGSLAVVQAALVPIIAVSAVLAIELANQS